MTGSPLDFLYNQSPKPVTAPAPSDSLGFLYENKKPEPVAKQEASQQGFADYLGNLTRNWFTAGAAHTLENVAVLMSPGGMERIAKDPSIGIAANDLVHIFDHVLSISGSPTDIASGIGREFAGREGSSGGLLTGLAEGAVKPVSDLMELSSGLSLTGDDIHALTPEEKAARIKNSVALAAAGAVAGPLSNAIGPAGKLASRMVKGVEVGSASGAAYGMVSAANEKDQLSQIITGGIMGGTLGIAHGLLPEKSRPEDIALLRQAQIGNSSVRGSMKMAQALATADDLAEAVLTGKLGLKENNIISVPGVNPERLSALNAQVPDGYFSAMYIDKDGVGNLLVYSDKYSARIDPRFFERHGFVEDQLVSMDGSASQFKVINGDKAGNLVLEDILNDTQHTVPRENVRSLSNVEIHDPLAGSVAVNVVYHGTGDVFDSLDFSRFDPESLYGPGYYTTEDPNVAAEYAEMRSPSEYVAKAGVTDRTINDAWHDMVQRGVDHDVYDDNAVASLIRNLHPKTPGWALSSAVEDLVGRHPAFKQYFDKTVTKPANVKMQRLAIKNPFDIDKTYTTAEQVDILRRIQKNVSSTPLKNEIQVAINHALHREQFGDDAAKIRTGERLYDDLESTAGMTKAEINANLKAIGYDGITHIGGRMMGDHDHQVWIAFDASQVRAPFSNPAFKVPSLTDRESGLSSLYGEWKSSLNKPLADALEATQKPKGDVSDLSFKDELLRESNPTDILETIPEQAGLSLQQHLDKFISDKGFDPQTSNALKLELQKRLATEANLKYLEPEEHKMIEDANKAIVSNRKQTQSEKRKSNKQLARIAASNGMSISDGGSGRVIVRSLDDGVILKGFDSNEEAARWINKTGQATGVNLDSNAAGIDTGIGGGGRGLPPSAGDGSVNYPSDGPYNYFTRAKNLAKATVGESFIRGLDNFKLITRNREFMLKIDTDHGTQIHKNVMENTQRYRNIRDAQMHPWVEKINTIFKTAGKLSEAEREDVGRYMQTMSPNEVIQSFMSRPMNPLEVSFARKIVDSKVDTEQIFRYRDEVRKLDRDMPMSERQADPAVEQAYQLQLEGAKQAYKMDASHLAVNDTFENILNMAKNEASLGAVVRLARSIADGELTKNEFAAKHKLSMEQMRAAVQLGEAYKKLADEFDIPNVQRLGGYMTHARLYTDGNLTQAMNHFSGDLKAKEFFAKMSRTGEISAYEMDPFKAAMRYVKSGFDVKSGFSDSIKDAKNSLATEIPKLPAAKRENTTNVVMRYLNDIQGFPEAGDRAAQESVNALFDQYKLGEDVNVRRQWVGALTNTFAAAGLGMRPMLGIGHFGISTIISTAARSASYTARVLKAGAHALAHPEVMEDLQTSKGTFSALAPFANIKEPGVLSGVIDKGSDLLFKTTLLPTAYNGFAAGHYLVTSADALEALTKFDRKEIKWKDVEKKTFLSSYDQPVIDRFKELAKTNPKDASDYLGVQAINDLVGVYSGANHPYMWGTNTGRILGQFGNFAMWSRSTVQRMASRGTTGQRMANMAKLTAMSYGVSKLGDELGVDLNRMNPYHAMFWLGGPLLHIAEDAATAMKSTGYAQAQASTRLKKLLPIDSNGNMHPSIFIPMSFAIDGLVKAADDFSQGNIAGGVGSALGFHAKPTPKPGM